MISIYSFHICWKSLPFHSTFLHSILFRIPFYPPPIDPVGLCEIESQFPHLYSLCFCALFRLSFPKKVAKYLSVFLLQIFLVIVVVIFAVVVFFRCVTTTFWTFPLKNINAGGIVIIGQFSCCTCRSSCCCSSCCSCCCCSCCSCCCRRCRHQFMLSSL